MRRRTTAGLLAAGLVLAGAPLATAQVTPPTADRMKAVQLVLPWRDRAGAMELVKAVSAPASPRYRDYLSADAFRARFSPTAADVAAISDWLRRAGLDVGKVPAN